MLNVPRRKPSISFGCGQGHHPDPRKPAGLAMADQVGGIAGESRPTERIQVGLFGDTPCLMSATPVRNRTDRAKAGQALRLNAAID